MWKFLHTHQQIFIVDKQTDTWIYNIIYAMCQWARVDSIENGFVTFHAKTCTNGFLLNGWDERLSNSLQTVNLDVWNGCIKRLNTGNLTVWMGHEIFRMVCQNVRMAYEIFRMVCQNVPMVASDICEINGKVEGIKIHWQNDRPTSWKDSTCCVYP